jgi:tRNA uridine 5-carboxymethylaminomethyl modification enzyme
LRDVELKLSETDKVIKFFSKQSISPEEVNGLFEEKNSAKLTQKVKLESVITRPHISLGELAECSEPLAVHLMGLGNNKREVLEQAEVQMKYQGYINKQEEQVHKMHRLEEVKIPADMDYSKFSALSSESKEKLNSIQPGTLGQASRISGIKPSDVSVLMVYLGR